MSGALGPNPAMLLFRRQLRAVVPVMIAALLLALAWRPLADVHLHLVTGYPVHLHAGAAAHDHEHHGHHGAHGDHHHGQVLQVDLDTAALSMKQLSMSDIPILPVLLLMLILPTPFRRLAAPRRRWQRPQPPPPHLAPLLRAPPPGA